MGPRLRKVSQTSQDTTEGAAGLTSSKICEIGPGQVNKYDIKSPRKHQAAAEVRAANIPAGRVPGEETGAAGLTSKEIANNAISEQEAVQKRMSLLAAHSANARALSPSRSAP